MEQQRERVITQYGTHRKIAITSLKACHLRTRSGFPSHYLSLCLLKNHSFTARRLGLQYGRLFFQNYHFFMPFNQCLCMMGVALWLPPRKRWGHCRAFHSASMSEACGKHTAFKQHLVRKRVDRQDCSNGTCQTRQLFAASWQGTAVNFTLLSGPHTHSWSFDWFSAARMTCVLTRLLVDSQRFQVSCRKCISHVKGRLSSRLF